MSEEKEKKLPDVVVKMGAKELQLSSLKIFLPTFTLGDPKSINVNSSGITIPTFYRKNYFKKGMDVYVDDESKVIVFIPNDENPSFSVTSQLRSLKRQFNLKEGKYRAEWIEEHKVLLVDLNEHFGR